MPRAVLLSHHGTIESLDDLPAFLANIRRGRPAPPELLAEVRHRYERIGGSPLMRDARALAASLELRLGVPVRVAGRLWHPYPKAVLEELVAAGATEVLSLPLAPQSVDVYNASVREAAAGLPLEVAFAPAWGLEPALLEAFAETVDEGLARLAAPEGEKVAVVLSAHSLPVRVIASGDRYEADFREMAAAVAAPLRARGLDVRVAFQSQGASAEAWLGPDLPATFAALHEGGVPNALVAPIGFMGEHIETLFDLDIDAVKLAETAGLRRYARAKAVSTRARFVDAVEAVARRWIGP